MAVDIASDRLTPSTYAFGSFAAASLVLLVTSVVLLAVERPTERTIEVRIRKSV